MQIPAGFRLTQFETYAEMANRPRFVDEVDITGAVPEIPIGVYFLREYQRCGIKSCRTQHQKGVLIRLSDGRETLIGRICGARKIGLEFTAMMSAAERQDRRTRDREKVAQAIADSATNLARVDALLDQPHGARWLDLRERACRRLLPAEALTAIRRMARHDTPTLYRERPMDKWEISVARETGGLRGPGPHYKQIEAGVLRGLGFWTADLRALLIDEIRAGLSELSQADVAALAPDAVTRHAKWAGGLDAKCAAADDLIAAGREFFSADNLAQLKLLASAAKPIKGLADAVDKLIRDSVR